MIRILQENLFYSYVLFRSLVVDINGVFKRTSNVYVKNRRKVLNDDEKKNTIENFTYYIKNKKNRGQSILLKK